MRGAPDIAGFRPVVRRIERRPRLLFAPIAAVLLAGALSATTAPDRRDEEPTAPSTPSAGDAAAPARPSPPRRSGTTLAERPATAPSPAAPAAVDPPAAAPPAPTAEPPPSAPPAPAGRIVHRPPPAPERAAPAPAEQPTAIPGRSTAVHPREFADPSVVRAHGVYWAFATQAGLDNVPTMRSSDLVHWQWVGDALRELPAWAEWGHTWAPSVLQRGSTFVLYYTTRHAATGLQCISRAVGVLPQGPYVDRSGGPLVCQTERGGSIDPSPFVDDRGGAWLLWKSEGTTRGEPTRIWVQALHPDGTGLTGQPTQLLERRLPWEHPIIENPSMVAVGGRLHLFYSGNRWEGAGYAVGHALCASVTGPCRRSVPHPVLATRAGEAGPGGQHVVRAPNGDLVLLHHAWAPEAVGYGAGGSRRLHVSALRFHGDRVTVGGPWGDRSGRLLGGPLSR